MAFSRQDAVDEFAGEPRVADRIEQFGEALRRQVRRDRRVLLQLVEQMAVVRERPLACRGNEVMRLLAPDLRRQRHHHRLGRDHASSGIKIAPHARRIDDQTLEHRPDVVQRACSQREGLRQCDPLGVPRPGRALVVLYHGVQHDRDQLANVPGAGEDELAGDRVALLRHGAAAAAPFLIRLRDLADLGLHQNMSVAILPSDPVSRPRKLATSARPSRPTCQAIGGGRRPSSAASSSITRMPSAPERADRAAELHDRDLAAEPGARRAE